NASGRENAVTVSLSRSSGNALLTVSDEGPGLSDEAKGQALERFWRGDPSRPGTGLGLAIAQTLAEASGGSLELRDHDGPGLSVVITLPVAAGRTEPAPPPPT
ncbi:MAG: sensor histidine kinase, partial [Acidimicrobiia bacterium]|nr:sensor histidine kinase [Acidimicrobiia bacterium]